MTALRLHQEPEGDPDWKKKAWAIKWLANNRCQVCNELLAPGEVHHNTYKHKGNEIPRDLVALCDYCHALFHWSKSDFGNFLRRWIRERKIEARQASARLGMFSEYFSRRMPEISATLSEIISELDCLEAGFSAWDEYEEGREAA